MRLSWPCVLPLEQELARSQCALMGRSPPRPPGCEPRPRGLVAFRRIPNCASDDQHECRFPSHCVPCRSGGSQDSCSSLGGHHRPGSAQTERGGQALTASNAHFSEVTTGCHSRIRCRTRISTFVSDPRAAPLVIGYCFAQVPLSPVPQYSALRDDRPSVCAVRARDPDLEDFAPGVVSLAHRVCDPCPVR